MTLVLLETRTAAASSSLDFTTRNAPGQGGPTIQADFDEYLLEFLGIIPATNAVELILRMGTGAGPTFDAGAAAYTWVEWRNIAGAAAAGGASADGIRLTASPDFMANTAGWGFSGAGRLYNPNPGVIVPRFSYHASHLTGGGAEENRTGDGGYLGTAAITALRLLMSSGNIASGIARLFANRSAGIPAFAGGPGGEVW